MLIEFSKYQGAGNDFIMFDGRNVPLFSPENHLTAFFRNICHRNFGIGADGVIVLFYEPSNGLAMKYYNSDGREGSMCGNGGRCLVAFANDLGLINTKISFRAIDGIHEAKINDFDGFKYNISLKMNDVDRLEEISEGIFINTGSPHLVVFCQNISQKDVVREGRELRYSQTFDPAGVNVNFVEMANANNLKVRTYERGVENETLACGTGAVAAAVAAKHINNLQHANFFEVEALGGKLQVSFQTENNTVFKNVWLTGPAEKVFEGKVWIND